MQVKRASTPPPIFNDLDLRNFKKSPIQSLICATCMWIRSKPSFLPPHQLPLTYGLGGKPFFVLLAFLLIDALFCMFSGNNHSPSSPKLNDSRLLTRPGVHSFRPCLWYSRTGTRQVRRDSLRIFGVIIRDCRFDCIFGEHRAVYCHQTKIGS